jgi:hypothetical protein
VVGPKWLGEVFFSSVQWMLARREKETKHLLAFKVNLAESRQPGEGNFDSLR